LVTASIVSVLPALPAEAGAQVEATPFSLSTTAAGFEPIGHEHGVYVYKDKRSNSIRLAAEGRFQASPDVVMPRLRKAQSA
jgi:hypothetical protein